MSTAVSTIPIAAPSPQGMARMAGCCYLVTFVSGITALLAHGRMRSLAELIAGASYVAVTVLLFFLFRRVSVSLSAIAAGISLAGCVWGPVGLLLPSLRSLNPLVLFGFYCLLLGYLIYRSRFLPRVLGVLMALAGLGWLVFLFPQLAKQLSPYIFVPGVLGEGALTVWLIVAGVNVQRWRELASPRMRV